MIRGCKKFLVGYLLIALTACSSSSSGFSPSSEANSLFFRRGSGSVTPTIYFLPQYKKELDWCTDGTKDFISPNGQVLERLCTHQWKECLLQGTCKVSDGSREIALHYHSRRGSEYRFTIVDLSNCPYGIGARDEICLDPYHSVAADLSVQKLGDVIFIPAVRGAKLPDGSIHDGYFIVRDTGGAIDGIGRFDFYIGTDSYHDKQNALVKLGFGDISTRVPFQVVTGDLANRVRIKRNYPGLPEATKAPTFHQTLQSLPAFGGHTMNVLNLDE